MPPITTQRGRILKPADSRRVLKPFTPDEIIAPDTNQDTDVSDVDMTQVGDITKRQTRLGGFLKGIAKGGAESLQNIGQAILAAPALVPGGKTFRERKEEIKETTGLRPETLEAKTPAEKVGKFVERVGEFAVPATAVTKLIKGANFLTRLATRAATSGGVATIQAGEIGKETGIAAGVEAILPVAGKVVKPIFNIIRRLFKGIGSGLSGVSTDAIDTIIQNPQRALEVSEQIKKVGNFKVLEDNAKTIVEGVSKVRQDARKAFGVGLEKLKAEDISPKTFRSSIQKFLDSIGSIVKGDTREFTKVEFEDPKNIQKASNLIEELSNVKMDGLSLRKLLDKISNSRFKTATTDERLSYNAFISEFEKTLKTAISDSTDKLKEINKAFSRDMQLVEGIERIFGKIKFKSLAEIDKVALKLEQLFSQKGLNPRDIDDFLTKIGIKPAEFRTTEAVRQISNKEALANRVGLTFAELTQSVTSAVVTPETIKNISIVTGLAEPVISEIFKKVSPTARGVLLEFLVEGQD